MMFFLGLVLHEVSLESQFKVLQNTFVTLRLRVSLEVLANHLAQIKNLYNLIILDFVWRSGSILDLLLNQVVVSSLSIYNPKPNQTIVRTNRA